MSDKEYCRFCGNELKHTLVDLGMQPLSNSYIPLKDKDKGQATYPLHARVCEKCWLVQLGEFESPENIFSDYAYFSSYSSSWLKHAKDYTEYMTKNFDIGKNSKVIEIASNDGYLLQYFKEKGIPILGIEPAKNVAKVAEEKGIPTISEFFGESLAKRLVKEGKRADLLLGNNVFAHVPDINDFAEGLKILLADDGVLTLEFPHLLNLMEKSQFDTIYHEHFSYISLTAAKNILEAHELKIFDVQELSTHGGSLRLFVCHKGAKYEATPSVDGILAKETDAGLTDIETYLNFSEKAKKIKYDLLSCLIDLKRKGKKIAAYGAAAKGNTLLNYCGIGSEFLDYVVDKSPHKQSTLLPGSRIPVVSPDALKTDKPDYILILPWNLEEEIKKDIYNVCGKMKYIVPIPNVRTEE